MAIPTPEHQPHPGPSDRLKLGPPRCECSDPGCPGHYRPVVTAGTGARRCKADAVATLTRIDSEDQTGTRMCEGCADDAMETGLFTLAYL